MNKSLQIIAVTILSFPISLSGAAQANQQEGSTNIKSFIDQIWKQNPVIQEAQAKLLASEANVKAASKWQYNPEIGFEYEDVDGEDKTKLIGISQTIDWSGKSRSSGKTASFEAMAWAAEYDSIRQNVTIDILSSLADFKSAKNIFNLASKRSGLMERFVNLADKGFKAGDIDQSEYNLAQLALSESLIAEADANATLNQSKLSLNSAIGFTLSSGYFLPELPASLPNIEIDNRNEDDVLMQLPSLRAMKSREESAKAIIKQANKDRFPDPTIGITGGKDAGADLIGFSFSIPLHVLNSYGAEVDVAKQEAIAAAKAFKNALYSARMNLKTSRDTYISSKRAWQSWQKNGAKALTKQTDILDRKFKVGDLSATDYLVQVEQAIDTQIAAEELHAKVWGSWFTWLAASGNTEQWTQNSGEIK